MLVFDIMATGGNLSETYIRVRTNTLDEQDTKLRLPGLDRLVEQLASMEGAVGRVKDTDCAATRDEVIQQLLKCIESKLLAYLSGFRIVGVKKLGRLICRVDSFELV